MYLLLPSPSLGFRLSISTAPFRIYHLQPFISNQPKGEKLTSLNTTRKNNTRHFKSNKELKPKKEKKKSKQKIPKILQGSGNMNQEAVNTNQQEPRLIKILE